MWKKLFVCAAVLALTSTVAHAKAKFGEKGSIAILGEVSFSSQSGEVEQNGNKSDLPDVTELEMSPTVGFFVMKSFMLAGRLVVDRETSEQGNNENTQVLYGLDVAPAYYFRLSPEGNNFLYGRGFLGYTTGEVEQKTQNQTTTQDISGFRFGAGAGFAMAFGTEVGGLLQIGLDFVRQTGEIEQGNLKADITQDDIRFATALGLFF